MQVQWANIYNIQWPNISSLHQMIFPYFFLIPASISNPFSGGLVRNPAFKTAGSFMTLVDFLTFAKDQPITGILICIEVSAYPYLCPNCRVALRFGLCLEFVSKVVSTMGGVLFCCLFCRKLWVHLFESSHLMWQGWMHVGPRKELEIFICALKEEWN